MRVAWVTGKGELCSIPGSIRVLAIEAPTTRAEYCVDAVARWGSLGTLGYLDIDFPEHLFTDVRCVSP